MEDKVEACVRIDLKQIFPKMHSRDTGDEFKNAFGGKYVWGRGKAERLPSY